MRYPRAVLLSASLLALGGSAAYGELDDNDEEVDAMDIDLSGDEISDPLPLEELSKIEQLARKMEDQKNTAAEEHFKMEDDEDMEEESTPKTRSSSVDLEGFEALGDEELNDVQEEEQEEKPEEKAISSSSSASVDGSRGGFVQTEDEEGTQLDTSTLSHPDGDDGGAQTIQTFIDTTPKFKKEEEDKQKRKEEAKERKKNNNDIYEYEAEFQTFREAQEKNKSRFTDGIENAEVDMQAPLKPSWWKRLKHWYNVWMNHLNEKYASEEND